MAIAGIALLIAIASFSLSVAAWLHASKPRQDLQQLSKSLDNLTIAVEGMK